MDIINGFKLLKEEIEAKEAKKFLHLKSKALSKIMKNRVTLIYGDASSGKTTIIKDLIKNNNELSFLCASTSLDKLSNLSKYNNVALLAPTYYEEIIEFVTTLDKGSIDILVINNFNLMPSLNEAMGNFDVQTDRINDYNIFLRTLSKIAVVKDFSIIISTGINPQTKLPLFSFIFETMSTLTLSVNLIKRNRNDVEIGIKEVKNIFNKNRQFKVTIDLED